MSTSRPRRSVLVDCDTGLDDALAILLLANDPACEIVGVGTVDGNVGPELGAANSLRVLEVAGLGAVPVAVGAAAPLLQVSNHAEFFHGKDGLGDANLAAPTGHWSAESAVEQMLRVARSRPGQISLLAIGPLTNVALALGVEPRLPSLISDLVVMGGAVGSPGNESPWAEFNVAHDPEAAEIVLRAPWRELVLVGLNATSQAMLAPRDVSRLAGSGSAAANFATRILERQMAAYGRFELCDPLAAGLLLDPSLATYQSLPVHVDLDGASTRGATLADRRSSVVELPPEPRPEVLVADKVDHARFLARFLDLLEGAG